MGDDPCATGRCADLGAPRDPSDAAAPVRMNAHPTGGTIAGRDPATNVVDADLKVHGLANLHVCGGSVIPRGGTAIVTTVIVQLALRQVDIDAVATFIDPVLSRGRIS